jgi:TatD DNase family protein
VRLLDTHCHIHFPDYAQDREEVLLRMQEEGIGGVTIGTTLKTSREAVLFAEMHENIWASVGYHPEHFTSAFVYQGEEDKEEYSIDEIKKLAQSSKKVVAIGETGLDFYRIDEGLNREEAMRKQEEGFREHIKIAHELDLTLVVHCREALSRLAEILREEQQAGRTTRTIVHCFSGTWEEAKPLLELGCYLSFAGVITFPPKKTQDPEAHVHRVIERMPLHRILVETDAPFLTPVPHRGKRNEPAYVSFVAKKIAEIRNVETGNMQQTLLQNAKDVFQI